ncbi:MAG: YabP/YqfC family sporulation protein [Oscillospiraceae bacterium]|nr:YabP/YqfC family sporulation protein [Oscillospiraceae bacterium]
MRKNRRGRDAGEESPKPRTGISELFDIPGAVITQEMQIELAGNTEAVITGCTGVLEYNPDAIRLAGKKLSAKFTGRGLQLRALTQNSAVVQGYILNVEFIER